MPDLPQTTLLPDDGAFPNSRLPVLLYRRAVQLSPDDPASAFEHTFESHGWSGTWRNGIYDFHHYHSTAHEVLGIARGRVRVLLGGPQGEEFTLEPGDVVLLPAGTSHRNLSETGDLLVVGAYPAGQSPDMNYGRPGERPRADENLARVPLPDTDPVHGRDGPLIAAWRPGVR